MKQKYVRLPSPASRPAVLAVNLRLRQRPAVPGRRNGRRKVHRSVSVPLVGCRFRLPPPSIAILQLLNAAISAAGSAILPGAPLVLLVPLVPLVRWPAVRRSMVTGGVGDAGGGVSESVRICQ